MPLIIPMSPEADIFQRVRNISKQFDRILHSALPMGMIANCNIFGLLLGVVGQTRFMPNRCTYIHTNLAYFGEPIKMFGTILERGVIVAGLQRKKNPLIVMTESYNGKLGLNLVGDKGVFPDEKSLSRVASYVEDEFKLMDGQFTNCNAAPVTYFV